MSPLQYVCSQSGSSVQQLFLQYNYQQVELLEPLCLSIPHFLEVTILLNRELVVVHFQVQCL
jgi:hypothetical protein